MQTGKRLKMILQKRFWSSETACFTTCLSDFKSDAAGDNDSAANIAGDGMIKIKRFLELKIPFCCDLFTKIISFISEQTVPCHHFLKMT